MAPALRLLAGAAVLHVIHAAAFTANNIVVLRVGSGSGSLSSSAQVGVLEVGWLAARFHRAESSARLTRPPRTPPRAWRWEGGAT